MNAENRKEIKEYQIRWKNLQVPWADVSWLIARLEAEAQDNERLDRLLQSLTPGGSEFVHDPERCVRFVQQARTGELQALKNAVVLRQAAEARADALEALFQLQQTRMKAATEAWQEATGKRDVLPDLGDLLAWLLSRPRALEAECRRLREDEPRIREYLAFSHTDGKCNIYADDGELQCANLARHGRTIDFRREPIADLLGIIIGTRQREYAAALAPQEQGKEEGEAEHGSK